jgi:hypothetical protein
MAISLSPPTIYHLSCLDLLFTPHRPVPFALLSTSALPLFHDAPHAELTTDRCLQDTPATSITRASTAQSLIPIIATDIHNSELAE